MFLPCFPPFCSITFSWKGGSLELISSITQYPPTVLIVLWYFFYPSGFLGGSGKGIVLNKSIIEQRRHVRVAQGHGLWRVIAREWKQPGLLFLQKSTLEGKSITRWIHERSIHTGRTRRFHKGQGGRAHSANPSGLTGTGPQVEARRGGGVDVKAVDAGRWREKPM